VLRFPSVTSALIGASRPDQIKDNVASLNAGPFTQEQLAQIDKILTSQN
jgi:L-glyceraldehyde 3-phosphate reductase